LVEDINQINPSYQPSLNKIKIVENQENINWNNQISTHEYHYIKSKYELCMETVEQKDKEIENLHNELEIIKQQHEIDNLESELKIKNLSANGDNKNFEDIEYFTTKIKKLYQIISLDNSNKVSVKTNTEESQLIQEEKQIRNLKKTNSILAKESHKLQKEIIEMKKSK